jgi:hypothetical protein
MTTRVWEDPWILSNPGFKPLVKPANAIVVLASELLTACGDALDDVKLQENFSGADIKVISCVPIGRLVEDVWA